MIRGVRLRRDADPVPPALLGRAAAAGALAGLAGAGLSTRLAFAGRPYTGDTLVVLSLRGGFDGLSARRADRRPRLLPGPAHHRGAEGPGHRRQRHVRPAPGAGAAAAAVAGRHAGRRARGRPAEPDPLALRRDGGDGTRRGRHLAAHRLAGPDARRHRRDRAAGRRRARQRHAGADARRPGAGASRWRAIDDVHAGRRRAPSGRWRRRCGRCTRTRPSSWPRRPGPPTRP